MKMIYFIQQGEDGSIKIGHTDGKDAQKRLSELQTENPKKLHILATMKGDKTTEQNIYKRFISDRLYGGWFKPSPELMSFITFECTESLGYAFLKQSYSKIEKRLEALPKKYEKVISMQEVLIRELEHSVKTLKGKMR